MPSRILSTGLLAGLVMNIFGWLGNQLWLGREWDAAKACGDSRSIAYRAAGLLWMVAIATSLLGTANASLVPWRVSILTLVLALVTMIPVTELVWRRLVAHRTASRPRRFADAP